MIGEQNSHRDVRLLRMTNKDSTESAPHEHVHGPDCNHDHPAVVPFRRMEAKVGRNDPCHCGSGKKFKKCHAD